MTNWLLSFVDDVGGCKEKMNSKKYMLVCLFFCFLLFSSVCFPMSFSSAEPETGQYYGFVIPVFENQSFYQQIEIVKAVNLALSHNVSVYWVVEPFECEVDVFDEHSLKQTESFAKGSFLIDASSNVESLRFFAANLSFLSYFQSVPVYTVLEPLDEVGVRKLCFPRIVYHDGDNVAHGSYEYVLEESGFSQGTYLNWRQIPSNLSSEQFDVFVWGGHYGNNLDVVLGQLNWDSFNAIRSFIREGGGYIGSCYGGYEITTALPFPLRNLLIRFPNLPSSFFLSVSSRLPVKAMPGYCYINVSLTDFSSPLSFGLPEKITDCWYAEGPVFLGRDGETKDIAVIDDIDGRYFWGDSNLGDYGLISNLKERWMNFSIGKPIWVTTEFGDGRVIAFGDHPETHDYYPRIVHNAIFYATSSDPTSVSLSTPLVLYNLSECVDVSCFRGYAGVPLSFNFNNSSDCFDVFWQIDERIGFCNESCKYSYRYADNYSVVLTIIDEDMNLCVSCVPVEVKNPVGCNIHSNVSEVFVNDSVKFSLDVWGGFPPYSLCWSVDGIVCSFNESFCYVFSESGNYSVDVVIGDELGSEFDFEKGVVVGERRSEPEGDAGGQLAEEDSSSDSSQLFLGMVLGGGIVVCVLGVVLFFMYGGKSR